jgi:4-hydroxythreonine-4-phosphate dehydrogenase
MATNQHKPSVAISMGDPLGIGPEIILRALADPAIRALAHYRVHAHPATLAQTAQHLGLPMVEDAGVRVVFPTDLPPALHERHPRVPAAEAGRASFLCLTSAINDLKRPPGDPDRADALVTAPIAKESWHLTGINYPGHTELLANEFNAPESKMLFVGPTLRVILATIHVALADVPRLLTTAKVRSCIEQGARACRALGVAQPRIAVAGLNPHAGEHGLFGREDEEIIAPAVEAAKAAGLRAFGPVPGDAVFLAAVKGQADLVVAMYHDQGLIPVKLLDREQTVNVTTGLAWQGRPIIRTSPAHGTAFDIAGQGLANDASLRSAIRLAVEMVHTNQHDAANQPA